MIGVLLLVQWLTSAYACPLLEQPASDRQGEAVVASAEAADCHGIAASMTDAVNPALCKVHCDADTQAPVVKAQGDIPSPLLAWFIVASPVLHDVLPAPVHARGEILCGGPPGWPPLYLTHQVLRN